MEITAFTSVDFVGPETEFRPSKHVTLLVRAALRKARASACSLGDGEELIRDTDFCSEDSVIWCSSVQS